MPSTKVVWVRWIDSAVNTGWQQIPDSNETLTMFVESVGLLLHETEDEVVIAQSTFDEGDLASEVLAIPRQSIDMKEVISVG